MPSVIRQEGLRKALPIVVISPPKAPKVRKHRPCEGCDDAAALTSPRAVGYFLRDLCNRCDLTVRAALREAVRKAHECL